jgi:hypothetical protein
MSPVFYAITLGLVYNQSFGYRGNLAIPIIKQMSLTVFTCFFLSGAFILHPVLTVH